LTSYLNTSTDIVTRYCNDCYKKNTKILDNMQKNNI
jgi:hypothetical protein